MEFLPPFAWWLLAVVSVTAVLLPPLLHWLGLTVCTCTPEPPGAIFEAQTEVNPDVFTQLCALGFVPRGYLLERAWFHGAAWTISHRVAVFCRPGQAVFVCVYAPEAGRPTEVIFVTCLKDGSELATSSLADTSVPLDAVPDLARLQADHFKALTESGPAYDGPHHEQLTAVCGACRAWSLRHYRSETRVARTAALSWLAGYVFLGGYILLIVSADQGTINATVFAQVLVACTVLGLGFKAVTLLDRYLLRPMGMAR